jgi:hypothetical protein
MKAKIFKLIICLIMSGGITTFWAQGSYCHEIPQPHIHIKGKITTSDGQAIAGARLRLERSGSSSSQVFAPFVLGLPANTIVMADATESGTGGAPATYLTSPAGEYTIILRFLPGGQDKQQPVPADVSTLSIDRSKMAWEKSGYIIKSK